MSEAMPRRLRCAVYTRVSTDDGLDQEYNSIDAQRDAGHAYIASQRAEGWIPVADDYDDPAYSGGNMDRPGLKRLLVDIEAGRIDIVVVYKIDRLTRSLTDFSKMIELFERHGVSFVSVTQQFNTTNSMGRLMLNILLSFAQFEREVTGERIRDKIAASKKKGLWMGGIPPLGYDVKDRRLVINEREAKTVRHIFRGFVQLGSATLLVKALRLDGVTSKSWVTQSGRRREGKPIDKSLIYKLLNNRVYLGEIKHKAQWYKGDARAHHRSAALGPGPGHPRDQLAQAGQRHPQQGAVPAQGAGVRQRRAGHVAVPYQEPLRSALPLLPAPARRQGARRGVGPAPAAGGGSGVGGDGTDPRYSAVSADGGGGREGGGASRSHAGRGAGHRSHDAGG